MMCLRSRHSPEWTLSYSHTLLMTISMIMMMIIDDDDDDDDEE